MSQQIAASPLKSNTETSTPQTGKSRTSGPWAAYALALLALLWLGVLYAETLKEIALICWNDDDYSHGLILPFVVLYIFQDRKDFFLEKILPKQHHSLASKSALIIGAVLLLSGMTLLLLGTAANTLFIRWISFFPALIGVLFLLLGTRIATFAAPTLLLLYMAKPLPDSLVPKLFNPFQVKAAQISADVLRLLDVPVHLVGNIIEIPGMRLMVEEACSGMRSLMALMTVALIVISLVELSRFAKLLVVAMAVGVAVALNVLRVAMTGILAYFYDPDSATGFFHTFSGMVVFILGLIILYGLGSLLASFKWAKPTQSLGDEN